MPGFAALQQQMKRCQKGGKKATVGHTRALSTAVEPAVTLAATRGGQKHLVQRSVWLMQQVLSTLQPYSYARVMPGCSALQQQMKRCQKGGKKANLRHSRALSTAAKPAVTLAATRGGQKHLVQRSVWLMQQVLSTLQPYSYARDMPGCSALQQNARKTHAARHAAGSVSAMCCFHHVYMCLG
jgi:hypothetical protein